MERALPLKEKSGKNETTAKSQIPRNAKPNARTARLSGRRQAICRAHLFRRAAPGAAAYHVTGTTRIDPGAAVGGCAGVVVVPAVDHPSRHVAVHVVQAECIRQVFADRRRAPRTVVVARECFCPA